MIVMKEGAKIYARLGMTSFRKGTSGLAAFVQQENPQGLFSGDVFIFCGCIQQQIRILYWDRNGFCTWHKKLERDKFPWPRKGTGFKLITHDQMSLIFRGIDFWHEHREIEYKKIF
jgi:transposase